MDIDLKQKNKFTISKKIFIITFGLIFVVLIFSMLFQNIFFEDFYLSKRTKDLANDSVQFTKLYAYQNNDILLNKELFRFEQETNSKIAIFTFDGKLKVLNNYNTSSEDIKNLVFL